jgi:hypothetical protein
LNVVKFAVLGVVRNCAKSLRTTVNSIARAIGPEASITWVIIESDSDDSSLEELRFLAESFPSFIYESLGHLRGELPDRVERIRFARNRGLAIVRELQESFDWVVVADFDGVNGSLTEQVIADSIRLNPGYDGYFANSAGPYYDIFALRATGWVEEDYRATEKKLLNSGVGPIEAKWSALFSKQRVFFKGSAPIEVSSAFGGLGIYRWSSVSSASYSDPSASGDCEHVSFNFSLSPESRLAIIPSLQNNPEKRHVLYASGVGALILKVLRNLPRPWQVTIMNSARFFSNRKPAISRKFLKNS